MAEIQSRPYNPGACCEACVFGRGEHFADCQAKLPPDPARCDHQFPSHGWGPTGPCLKCGEPFESPHELHRFEDDGGAVS